MSRSINYLRRALFGVSCAVVFGFGATQAFAAPERAYVVGCQRTGVAYIPHDEFTCPKCPDMGYCDGYNYECICPRVLP